MSVRARNVIQRVDAGIAFARLRSRRAERLHPAQGKPNSRRRSSTAVPSTPSPSTPIRRDAAARTGSACHSCRALLERVVDQCRDESSARPASRIRPCLRRCPARSSARPEYAPGTPDRSNWSTPAPTEKIDFQIREACAAGLRAAATRRDSGSRRDRRRSGQMWNGRSGAFCGEQSRPLRAARGIGFIEEGHEGLEHRLVDDGVTGASADRVRLPVGRRVAHHLVDGIHARQPERVEPCRSGRFRRAYRCGRTRLR